MDVWICAYSTNLPSEKQSERKNQQGKIRGWSDDTVHQDSNDRFQDEMRGCQAATTPGSSHGQVVLHNPITSLNPLGYSRLSHDVSPLHCSRKSNVYC